MKKEENQSRTTLDSMYFTCCYSIAYFGHQSHGNVEARQGRKNGTGGVNIIDKTTERSPHKQGMDLNSLHQRRNFEAQPRKKALSTSWFEEMDTRIFNMTTSRRYLLERGRL
ncbi:unnamed protein product [Ectocarpus sp. 13 AM-2016]